MDLLPEAAGFEPWFAESVHCNRDGPTPDQYSASAFPPNGTLMMIGLLSTFGIASIGQGTPEFNSFQARPPRWAKSG
jgi:hypothetical protein